MTRFTAGGNDECSNCGCEYDAHDKWTEDCPTPRGVTVDVPDGLGFVLPGKTGVMWRHQVEGVACMHVKIEGVFVPIELGTRDLVSQIVGHNYECGTMRMEDELWQRVFQEIGVRIKPYYGGAPKGLLDEGGLEATSFEAWLWCRVVEAPDDLKGLVGRECVFVYPNCD